MFSRQKKDKVQYGVVFEIGSGSVAGAIVSSSTTNDSTVILYATREFLSLKLISQDEDISKRLISAFLTVATDIENKLIKHTPKKTTLFSICVNFTAPWSHTRGNTHVYESEKSVTITAKLLEKVIQATTKKLQSEVAAVNLLKEKNFTLINRTIVGHTANGYQIDNPIGKTAKTLTTAETISAVNNIIFTPTQDIIKKLFPGVQVHLFTSPLLHQQILHSQISTPSTFTTIHLTYEALEMTFYRENKIITAFTTPIGINTMARNIATASKLPHEQVSSFLTAEDTTSYQKTTQNKIHKASESKVIKPLVEFFTEVQSSELLPRDFYLITTLIPSPAIVDIINNALKSTTSSRFVLHNLYTPIVHNAQKTTLGSNDLGICTLAYFFHNNVRNN